MKNKCRLKTTEDYFYLAGGILLLLSVFALIYPGRQSRCIVPPCLFHLLTGYYCPGCGGTRAVRALLQGNICQSFYYHPLVPYGAGVYAAFMVSQTVERLSGRRLAVGLHYRSAYVVAAGVILVLNFAVKNLLHYKYGYLL